MPAASITRPWALLAVLLALAPPAARAAAPAPRDLKDVDFERHVMGLLGKMGCNSGSCHGSFQGKGGFRLSLFGYDPEADYVALTRDGAGRRLNRGDPDNSLLLLKATGQVDHGGLRRFGKDSWQYRLFRRWIADGMPRRAGRGQVKSVAVSPPEVAFKKADEEGRLTVTATFADGSHEDITALCDFRTNDEAVATVSPAGEVQARRPGDTSLVVAYRGNILPVRVLVPISPEPGFKYPRVAEANYVDRHVFAKLKRLNIVPSGLANDAEFLRRVHIDTTGSLPPPDEVRAFLASTDPEKRAKKIDELLKHPLHAALWATKFSDITGNSTDQLEVPQQIRPRLSQMWHDWFRKRVRENVPYDQIVHDVLCATSRDGDEPAAFVKKYRGLLEEAQKGFETSYAERKTLDLFWRRQQRVPPEQWGEKTAVAFLGVRVECAQCHKHPFDRWTQEDYWSYANLFSGVIFGISPEARAALTAGGSGDQQRAARQAIQKLDRELVARQKEIEKELQQERDQKRKALEKKFAGQRDQREAALRDLERELAAKGRRLQTEAINQTQARRRVLQRQAQQALPQLREVFVAARPNPVRTPPGTPQVSTARALGGPEIATGAGKDPREELFRWMRSPDNPFFARSFVNRVWGHYFGVGIVHPVDDFSLANPPSNEKLLDALAKDFLDSGFDIRRLERTILLSRAYQLSSATNATNRLDTNNYSHGYVRPLMAEVVVDVINDALGVKESFGAEAPAGVRAIEVGSTRIQNPALREAFRVFGRSPRTMSCDCERAPEPTVSHKLYLIADPSLQQKLQPARNRVRTLLQGRKADGEVLEELFLATLSRFPTDKERATSLAYVESKTDRAAAFGDVRWALVNTKEFIFNH